MRLLAVAAALLLIATVAPMHVQASPPQCDPDEPACDPPPHPVDPWADCRAPIPPGLKGQALWLVNCVVPY